MVTSLADKEEKLAKEKALEQHEYRKNMQYQRDRDEKEYQIKELKFEIQVSIFECNQLETKKRLV